MEKHFGKFKVTRGKLHDYLGMAIRIQDNKNVAICMRKKIEDIIENFSKPIFGKVTSPVSKNLYDTGYLTIENWWSEKRKKSFTRW